MEELRGSALRSFPVGVLSALRPGIRPPDLAAALPMIGTGLPVSGLPVVGPPLQLGSPWQDTSHLAAIIWQDILGVDAPALPMSRADAMAIPAAARGRGVICSTLARTTMRAYPDTRSARPGQRPAPLPFQPPWLERNDGAMSFWHMKNMIGDDLVWYGWSCLSRQNGADGYPLRLDHLPMGSWTFDEQRRVKVDRGDGNGFQHVPSNSVVLIPGPHEGLLTYAQSTLQHGRDLQRAADRAAKHPSAHIVLEQTEGTPLPAEDDPADPKKMSIRKLTGMWARARLGLTGGVAYTPPNIKARELGSFAAHLQAEGRNVNAVDIARMLMLPADLIDATTEGSFTYTNSRDNDRRGVDYGTGYYMGAISARLSMGDVTPGGQRVAFDVEEWLDGTVPGQDTQPPTQLAPVTPLPARETA